MKTYKLNEKDKELINMAKEVIKKAYSKTNSTSTSVSCILRTKSGKVYIGVNIRSIYSPPTSICAETGAIDQMAANGERDIETIVALWNTGKKLKVLPPCGACRHIIAQFSNPFVIISDNKKTKLKELYPLSLVEKKE